MIQPFYEEVILGSVKNAIPHDSINHPPQYEVVLVYLVRSVEGLFDSLIW